MRQKRTRTGRASSRAADRTDCTTLGLPPPSQHVRPSATVVAPPRRAHPEEPVRASGERESTGSCCRLTGQPDPGRGYRKTHVATDCVAGADSQRRSGSPSDRVAPKTSHAPAPPRRCHPRSSRRPRFFDIPDAFLSDSTCSDCTITVMHPGYCPNCGERVTPYAAWMRPVRCRSRPEALAAASVPESETLGPLPQSPPPRHAWPTRSTAPGHVLDTTARLGTPAGSGRAHKSLRLVRSQTQPSSFDQVNGNESSRVAAQAATRRETEPVPVSAQTAIGGRRVRWLV